MKLIAQDPQQTTQRVRVGMIGLAAVLLLIGLAAAIFTTATHERQVVVVGGARPEVVATMVAGNSVAPVGGTSKEPLAELGVAPSAASDEGNLSSVNNRASAPPK